VHAIQSGAPSAASRSRLARAIARAPLPVSLALGLKDLLARRHRALRLSGAIAITSAVIVFALSMKAGLDAQPADGVSDVPDELPVLVYTLDAVLLVITATTLVAIALLSVRERVRDYGVLKTIGCTPKQITFSLVTAHTALALIAALLSIPAGVGLYRAVYAVAGGSSEDLVNAPFASRGVAVAVRLDRAAGRDAVDHEVVVGDGVGDAEHRLVAASMDAQQGADPHGVAVAGQVRPVPVGLVGQPLR
jgi:hypothetical protein